MQGRHGLVRTHLVFSIYIFIPYVLVYSTKYHYNLSSYLMECHVTPTVQRMSQITGAGDLLLFGRISPCFHSCYHHPSTMTGHKPDSHKKRTITRLQDLANKRLQKKAREEVTPEATSAPPVVSQTQESIVVPDSPTFSLLPACDASTGSSTSSPQRQ